MLTLVLFTRTFGVSFNTFRLLSTPRNNEPPECLARIAKGHYERRPNLEYLTAISNNGAEDKIGFKFEAHGCFILFIPFD